MARSRHMKATLWATTGMLLLGYYIPELAQLESLNPFRNSEVVVLN